MPGFVDLLPHDERITHVEHVPARPERVAPWPAWVPDVVREALAAQGIGHLWAHQAAAAEAAWSGRDVVVATGTASGKSLAYQLPALSALAQGRGGAAMHGHRSPTVLYLSPTKALAADQLDGLASLLTDDLRATVRPAAVDGDNEREERRWARDHATWVLTNPDTLHHVLLPRHEGWARLFRGLRVVVVDECHHYRGVFGAHLALVLRRLQRVCAHHGSAPVFVMASATVAEPEALARRLTGREAVAVADDGSPHGATDVVLWEPPLLPGEPPARRPAPTEAAELLTDLVVAKVRTLAFVRSRRGAETLAMGTRRRLEEVDPELVERVATYRGGYLPEDRRDLERRLRSGDLVGLASTTALQLGIDVSGLDAVVSVGYPGTRAGLWQQLGRAGRGGQDSIGVMIARDDPLDTYLVHHPETLLGAPVEANVFDPDNPYVLGPHLAAAAQEKPLTEADLPLFGPRARDGLDALTAAGLLRRRAHGWFWTSRDRASDLADLRGSGGRSVAVVDDATGRMIGTVDASSADATVHEGAVYLHQGESWIVDAYDVDADGVASTALVHADQPDHWTTARSVTDVTIVEERRAHEWGPARIAFGEVEVDSQVVSFTRRRSGSGEVLSEEPLELPRRTLRTTAVWWTLDDAAVAAVLDPTDVPGAAHAAEHAAIGLLPLLATCDRWDIGGLSTALHPDTGTLTVFVYDGYAGGAGFAERGHAVARQWLTVTRDAIVACGCSTGCPSCVQSPKCGNGNEPLDKAGAVRLLEAILAGA